MCCSSDRYRDAHARGLDNHDQQCDVACASDELDRELVRCDRDARERGLDNQQCDVDVASDELAREMCVCCVFSMFRFIWCIDFDIDGTA
jgi:hypothetical protein